MWCVDEIPIRLAQCFIHAHAVFLDMTGDVHDHAILTLRVYAHAQLAGQICKLCMCSTPIPRSGYAILTGDVHDHANFNAACIRACAVRRANDLKLCKLCM